MKPGENFKNHLLFFFLFVTAFKKDVNFEIFVPQNNSKYDSIAIL